MCLPIIATTARTLAGDRQQCLDAGMNGYEPIQRSEVLIMIDSKCGSSPDEKPMGMDKALALSRVGDDVELLQEIARLFLDDAPRMISEIEQAIRSRDAAALDRAAHSLKGCVANFGAQGAFDAAFELEKKGRGRDLTGVDELYASMVGQLACLKVELEALAAGQ